MNLLYGYCLCIDLRAGSIGQYGYPQVNTEAIPIQQVNNILYYISYINPNPFKCASYSVIFITMKFLAVSLILIV